jgi:4-hydroxy-2-oxoheptanedioate aldolase
VIRFKDLLERERAPLGTWVKLPTVESVELMSLAGFDFVVVDLEHSPMSLETAATIIAVARGRGTCPLVRVPDHSPAWIQRCLDAGASGILAPHVDTVEQARSVAGAAHFEPRGTRGVGPTSRAGDWGLRPMGHYLAEGADVTVMTQVESDLAVRNIPDILAAGAVDALFVGPADLSVSLGVSATSPELTSRIHRVVEHCRAAGVPCGTAIGADPDRAAALTAEGFAFVMVSNDTTILGSGAAQLVERYRASCAR